MNKFQFEQTEFPERIACKAMPELEEGITSVEVTDWDENTLVYEVPSASVLRLNMPRLSPNIPNEVREPFEKGIGLGLVACRILNRNEDLLSVQLPTSPEPTTIVVPYTRLARKVGEAPK